ncbi:Transcriptional regulator (Fragment) OS=mine drainage metagenome GN=B1B_04892 PE=4 SV=1: ParBc [Gemmataceae bacterium]
MPRELPVACLSLHPDAGLVPEMPADQYERFLADVKARGILKPLELVPGTRTVIEGRHRLRAATDAGLASVPVVDADLGGDSPVVYMIRSALLRRQMTSAQTAALAVEIEERLAVEAKERQRAGARKGAAVRNGTDAKAPSSSPAPAPSLKSRDQAAAIAGTKPRAVSDAKAIKKAAPEVFEQMKAGKITMPEAKRMVSPAKAAPPAKVETVKIADGMGQAMRAFQKALKMHGDATPEWLEFVELVRAMRRTQKNAEYGVPHSKTKRAEAERPVDDFLSEFDQIERTPQLDFTRKT